jgi:hypothetical protein
MQEWYVVETIYFSQTLITADPPQDDHITSMSSGATSHVDFFADRRRQSLYVAVISSTQSRDLLASE